MDKGPLSALILVLAFISLGALTYGKNEYSQYIILVLWVVFSLILINYQGQKLPKLMAVLFAVAMMVASAFTLNFFVFKEY